MTKHEAELLLTKLDAAVAECLLAEIHGPGVGRSSTHVWADWRRSVAEDLARMVKRSEGLPDAARVLEDIAAGRPSSFRDAERGLRAVREAIR